VFVQISDENVHHVREIMDEVFRRDNFCAQVTFAKTSGFSASGLPSVGDYLIWYAKNKEMMKFRPLFVRRSIKTISEQFKFLESPEGKIISLNKEQIFGREAIPVGKRFAANDLASPDESGATFSITLNEREYWPNSGTHWRTSSDGINNLRILNRLFAVGDRVAWKRYEDDFPFVQLTNNWADTAQGGMAMNKIYVVQTVETTVERCLLMTTDPGELVLDITCGSGTTVYAAENWGRRWITCDTSRVAITLAKQRLMTANFDYFELAHPDEGVGSGFKYKTIPHIKLKSIANNEPAQQETLYDQPFIDSKRLRVTGPFTVEAVPAPVVKSFDEVDAGIVSSDAGAEVARSGETLRQSEWRDELLRTGVRAKGGKKIEFTRVEAARGFRYVQAEAETKETKPQKVYVVFGPEYAPLEQRTVELAYDEVKPYKPDILLFCALQFDEEAAKDIDEMNPEITRCLFLKAQMNADLFTDDLKKKRASNESFWLIGQPDVKLKEIKSGDNKGKYQIEVNGFDYYNPKTGNVESGGKGDIAMWLLDTDYDGRSLFPSQVFFPMASAKEGWATIARNLKAEIDEDKIEVFGGTVSLPFTPSKAVAVKIIDARGIESLKIIRL
jgi:adenine-specific DNA-methyltransferase